MSRLRVYTLPKSGVITLKHKKFGDAPLLRVSVWSLLQMYFFHTGVGVLPLDENATIDIDGEDVPRPWSDEV